MFLSKIGDGRYIRSINQYSHHLWKNHPLTGIVPGGIVAPNMNLSFMRTNDMNTTTTLRHEGVGRGSATKLR